MSRRSDGVWTVFLDRDGVLNRNVCDDGYVQRWDEFEWLPDAQAAVRLLNDAGALTVVVTNQRGVVRGGMHLRDVERIHQRMQDELTTFGARLDAFYVCPHGVGTCNCRKPEPGLFQQAQRDFPFIDFEQSFVVGDSDSDIEAGRRLGCRTIGICRGEYQDLATAIVVAPTLFEAVHTEIIPQLRRSEIKDELLSLSRLAERVADDHAGEIQRFADLYVGVLERGGKLCFAGNGGSAADAQHIAAEYVIRFRTNGGPISAIALTTDTSLLTACGNDFSFEEVFERQVEALCNPRDLLVLHSTSGLSANLCRAAEAAKGVGCTTAALLGGTGGELKEMVHHAIIVPSDSAARVQEIHMAIEHAICGLVERDVR